MPATASPDGNRIWRVATPQGTVLQKFYGERGGWLHAWARELGTRLYGHKTSTRAAGRRATEARLLRLWREAGLDVPEDLSGAHPDLANERTLVLEDVPGPLLSSALADRALPDARREELLRRFGRQWCARHRLALQRGEAALVQEHATLQHVIVSGERLVVFDLENAFRPRRDLGPILAKEIAATLRSLAKCVEPARLHRDLEVLIGAYEDTPRLAAAAGHYLDNPRPWWRLLWALDRRRARLAGRHGDKYVMLEALRDTLENRAS
ncbi:MAG TPA: hypothetical protein VFD43_05970 [Planctomycetota bacterium]|nr:hypothetical protein [Planctomycetota bacterium]